MDNKTTLIKCQSGSYLAFFNHRDDIMANGETREEALNNLDTLYEMVLEYEAKEKQQNTIEGDKRVNDVLEIIADESRKSDVRKYTCMNDFGYSQFERNIAKRVVDLLSVYNPVLERQPQELKEPNKDKDWEIVSFKGQLTDFIYILIDNEWVPDNGNNGYAAFQNTKEEIADSGCDIHSVLRLSDNCLFTEKGIYKDSMGRIMKPIKKFFVDGLVMYAQFDEGRGNNDGCLGINSIEPLTKEEEPKPVRQMWNRFSGIHDEGIVCEHFGCEEYNPLDKRHS